MSYYPEEAAQRVAKYCVEKGLDQKQELGWGQDGIVFSTTDRSAVKGFRYKQQFKREQAVYQRLSTHGITEVKGYSVPKLISVHNELLVIEMEIVNPPYVIDFASAYLDAPPDFPEDVLADAERLQMELFGDDWPQIELIVSRFKRYGIYLVDVNPRNIAVR